MTNDENWLPKGTTISEMHITLVNNEMQVMRIMLDDDGGGFYLRLEAEQPFAINSEELLKLAHRFDRVAKELNQLNQENVQ